MEISDLRRFLEVANYGSITAAAHSLFLSQPTLSAQMSRLERELHTKLFKRGQRTITLTPDGEYLRSRAEQIISLCDRTANDIQSGSGIAGALRIGTQESPALRPIAAILGSISEKHPAVRIHLIAGGAGEIENKLEQGSIDVAIVMGHRSHAGVNAIRLPVRNEWGVLLRKDDPLCAKSAITPADLVGQPLIASNDALSEARLHAWWAGYADRISVAITATLSTNSRLFVETKRIRVLSFRGCEDPAHGVVFRPLSPALDEPISVVWKKEVPLSRVSQLFLRTVRSYANGSAAAAGTRPLFSTRESSGVSGVPVSSRLGKIDAQ